MSAWISAPAHFPMYKFPMVEIARGAHLLMAMFNRLHVSIVANINPPAQFAAFAPSGYTGKAHVVQGPALNPSPPPKIDAARFALLKSCNPISHPIPAGNKYWAWIYPTHILLDHETVGNAVYVILNQEGWEAVAQMDKQLMRTDPSFVRVIRHQGNWEDRVRAAAI